MPAKKSVKKVTTTTKKKTNTVGADAKKSANTAEANAKNFAKNVEKEAKVLFNEETKELGSKIWNRRETASNEEKVSTIIGIVVLILGLYFLRDMIWGMLLIVLGILLVTGFFLKKRR